MDAMVVRYRINTSSLGDVFVAGVVDTDIGKAPFRFNHTLIAPDIDVPLVLVCETPFVSYADYYFRDNMRFMMAELGCELDATFDVPEKVDRYRAILLHGTGLQSLTQATEKRLHKYLASGGTAVVLANYYVRGSVIWANRLTEPYGIQIQDTEEAEIICQQAAITPEPTTAGLSKLHWFRPSPIVVSGRATLLVRSPTQDDHGFVARSGPDCRLYVIGQSLLADLVSIGWPFDNARLLANMLSTS
jgi:hypothetical protein